MRMRGQGLFLSARVWVSKDRQSKHTVRGERSARGRWSRSVRRVLHERRMRREPKKELGELDGEGQPGRKERRWGIPSDLSSPYLS